MFAPSFPTLLDKDTPDTSPVLSKLYDAFSAAGLMRKYLYRPIELVVPQV
jgi:hypothetical protein